MILKLYHKTGKTGSALWEKIIIWEYFDKQDRVIGENAAKNDRLLWKMMKRAGRILSVTLPFAVYWPNNSRALAIEAL